MDEVAKHDSSAIIEIVSQTLEDVLVLREIQHILMDECWQTGQTVFGSPLNCLLLLQNIPKLVPWSTDLR